MKIIQAKDLTVGSKVKMSSTGYSYKITKIEPEGTDMVRVHFVQAGLSASKMDLLVAMDTELFLITKA